MQAYYPAAIVTLAAALVYFGMTAQVARTHARVGILAPIMTGDALLERTIRAHTNTLEWMPIFLPCCGSSRSIGASIGPRFSVLFGLSAGSSISSVTFRLQRSSWLLHTVACCLRAVGGCLSTDHLSVYHLERFVRLRGRNPRKPFPHEKLARW